MERKSIEFRQLCALVKATLMDEPAMEDAEWKERCKSTLAAWGFHPVPADQLSRAMTQVEHGLKHTVGPRPMRLPRPASPEAPTRPSDLPKEPRTSQPMGWDIVLRLMANLRGGNVSAPSSPPPGPRDTLSLSEEAALDEFYRAVRSGDDKIALLRAFSELAIVRPPGWDYATIRAESHQHRLSAEACFACGAHARTLFWHHVIQIQFGGSNYVRNRVGICDVCHGRIHPWLPQVQRDASGFYHVSQCIAPVLDRLRRRA